MKNIIVIILFAFATYTNAQMMGSYFRPDKADTITVTGKVIVDESFQHPVYFLDTNNDHQADYHLNLGPWWYEPDSTNAQRPNNGDQGTITGGKYQTGIYQFPTIVVYEINGEFWRDPFFAQWNNMGNHNHLYSWQGHGQYQGCYGFGWYHDTLKTIELSGTALVDTTFYMNYYYLDTDNDSKPNYFLNFGPFWYNPQSGALRPVDGETISIKGGTLGINTALPMIIVYEINGLIWRDSTKFFPHIGGAWMHENDSTKRFYTPFDYDDYSEMHKGWLMGGGHMGMNPDSLFGQIFESFPENMPNYGGQNFFAGYELNIFYPNGMNGMWGSGYGGGMMGFGNNMNFQFHYTDEQLSYYNMSEDHIKIMAWNSQMNNWQNINGTIDKQNNLIKFSTNTVSNYFALSSQSVTTVENNGNVPSKFALEQNYPNPFNPATTIKYSIPVSEFVRVKIYDVLGKEIATLVNREQAAGSYKVEFDGSRLASGIYLFKLQTNNFVETKKMVLTK
ncbi:MAG: T9SS type A sorting domain-containing protein [Ignavibacteria bacterium]